MKVIPLSAPSSGGPVSLRVLIPFLALFGAGLYAIVGLPHIPNLPLEIPDSGSVEALLRSSNPPLDGAIYVVGMAGWGVWGWLIVSLLLQLLAAGAERIAGGTATVRRLRNAADVLSVPLVRRAVQASLAGGMVIRVAMAGVPTAAAAPQDGPVVVVVGSPYSDAPAAVRSVRWAAAEVPADEIPADSVVYTVQRGDNLAKIAERFYADGDKWQVLYEANQGRRMQDGETFDRAGVIQPGWKLIVPEPAGGIQFDGEGRSWYTVRKGDSLAAISGQLLGDEQRWPELFDANEGVRLDTIHALSDPRLIWPGLVLHVPALDRDPSADPQAALTQQPAASPGAELTSIPSLAVPTSPTNVARPSTPTEPTAGSLTSPSAVQAPVVVESTPQPQVDNPSSSSALAVATAATCQPPEATRTPIGPQRLVSPMVGGMLGASVAVLGLAGTALVLRRRYPRSRRNGPESDVEVRAGFAEVEPTDDLDPNASTDDLNAAGMIAARLSRAVARVLLDKSGTRAGELPTSGATLAAVRHGRSSTTLMLQNIPMAARVPLIACLPEAVTRAFGERSDVEGMVSRDGDVLVRLSNVADQFQSHRPDDQLDELGAWPSPSLLLRLGLLADRQIFAANWDALGHVLVAAPLGQGAEAVLGGLLVGLVAKRAPAQLGLLILGSPRSLPEELLDLPHLVDVPVDPHDEQAALNALALVREELEKRIAGDQTEGPEVVVVLTELGQLNTEHMAALGPIMLHGPRYRFRVIAASTRRAVELAQHCTLLPEFGTRLVLRTPDEEDSIALLGSGDATELGPGGHLLARLEGRVPLQARGYRVAPDRLARLAAAVRVKAPPVDWWISRKTTVEPDREPEADATISDFIAPVAEPIGVEEPPRLSALDELDEQSADEKPGVSVEGRGDTETAERPREAESNQTSESPQLELPVTPGYPANGAISTPPANHYSLPAAHGVESASDRSRAESAVLTCPRPRLRGRFLGARELLYDGKVVWPVPGEPDEAAMELLVFLGVQDPSGVRAEVLGDSFWEEDDDEARPDRLKKRRYRLRLALKKRLPTLDGDPLARMDKQHPVYRLNPTVIESDVHRFLKLTEEARWLGPEDAVTAYEEALDLYRGDLLDRPDVPPYRWLDEGPRLVDLRVKYARIEQQTRRRLADLLAAGTDQQLARAEELYIGLAGEDPLDHRLWEALARLHGRRCDLLGLEATARRLRSALVELGEGEDPERVPMPPALERVFAEVRASLLNEQAA